MYSPRQFTTRRNGTRFRLLHMAVVTLVALAPARGQGTPLASVRGTVRDAATGAPVEGAEISVQSAAERFGGRVASDGSFAVERLPAGVVRVIVRRVGYGRDSTSVTLTAGASATVSFRLIRTETRLSEVRVKGEASIVSQQPFTENVIDTRVMKQLHQADSPLKLVEQMPGIDVQNFNQGGLNSPFTIRGFESGGHGGDTYVSLDGILLNDQMYGASDVNMIIPLELDRTTVVKGPASPLYGRFAKGGAFTFTTRKGGTYQDVQAQGGSFGLADIQLAAGRESGAWRANVAGQYHNSDSFRDATFYRKHNVAARIAYAPSERRELSLSARTHRGEWNSAGYLTAAQFNNPAARFRVNDRAAPQDPTDGSSKAFDAIRLDYSQSVGSTARLLVFANGLREEQDLFYSYTTGEEAQATYLTPRRQFAAGASLNGAGTIGARASNWVVGVEFLRERPNELFATGQRRNRFAVYNDRSFDIAYGAAFAQFEMNVHPAFRPSIGVRYDRFGGDLVLRDSFEVSSPITLQMNAYQSVAPKLGLRSTVFEGIELRGSVSNGYDIPTGDLAFRAFGDVNPTQLWQYETGVRFQRRQGLMLDLSAFVLDTDNEITAVANDPPRYENIGSTRRRGVEADLRWFLTPALELRATSSVHRSSVRSSVDTARVGLPVRLVPNGIHTLNLAWSSQNGVGLRLGVRNVGRYWTGEAATFYAGYTAVEGGVQYGRRVRSGGRVTGFVDVRNALDRTYASQASRQFWSPAAPRTIQGGVTWER